MSTLKTMGQKEGIAFHKQYVSCSSIYYPSFSDSSDAENVLIRRYGDIREITFFSATLDTYLEVIFLDNVSEDAFTCNSRLTNIVEKYNRIHKLTTSKLNYQRLNEACFLYL